jgi:hypothetical protein
MFRDWAGQIDLWPPHCIWSGIRLVVFGVSELTVSVYSGPEHRSPDPFKPTNSPRAQGFTLSPHYSHIPLSFPAAPRSDPLWQYGHRNIPQQWSAPTLSGFAFPSPWSVGAIFAARPVAYADSICPFALALNSRALGVGRVRRPKRGRPFSDWQCYAQSK